LSNSIGNDFPTTERTIREQDFLQQSGQFEIDQAAIAKGGTQKKENLIFNYRIGSD